MKKIKYGLAALLVGAAYLVSFVANPIQPLNLNAARKKR